MDRQYRPYRVGVVLHDFALGGTERVAVRLANAWAKEGADVTLFCGQPIGPLTAMVGEAVRIAPLAPAIARGWGSSRRLGRAVARRLMDEPVDMLFIPGNYHWAAIPPIAARRENRPHIVAQISAALYKPQRGRFRQYLFNRRMARLLRGADHLVAMSDGAAAQARAIVKGAQVACIETPALDDNLPPPLPLLVGPPTIMAIGRLVPEKGFAELIEAFALLCNRSARLVIVGSGPQEQKLKALARSQGIAERIEFTGYVADSRPWLDKAHLFILSSWFEGFPAVLVEALAAGRPVVATDCTPATGIFKALPGAGMTVPLRNIEAMANAIEFMLTKIPPLPEKIAQTVDWYRMGQVSGKYLSLPQKAKIEARHTPNRSQHSAEAGTVVASLSGSLTIQ